jgi:hypothetical protein
MKRAAFVIIVIVAAVVGTVVTRGLRKPAELSFPEKVAYFQSEAVSMAKESYGISLGNVFKPHGT